MKINKIENEVAVENNEILKHEQMDFSDYLPEKTKENSFDNKKQQELLKQKEEELKQMIKENEDAKFMTINSFDDYEMVSDRISIYYDTIKQRNASLTIKDIVLQTHLYLLPKSFIEPLEIKEIIKEAIETIWKTIKEGKAVILNKNLLFDSINFEKNIIPICSVDSKAINTKYVYHFSKMGNPNEEIIVAFSEVLENLLESRFYVELDEGIILFRKGPKGQEQNILLVSKETLKTEFSNIKQEIKDKEIYEELNLEEIFSNKNIQLFDTDKKEFKDSTEDREGK